MLPSRCQGGKFRHRAIAFRKAAAHTAYFSSQIVYRGAPSSLDCIDWSFACIYGEADPRGRMGTSWNHQLKTTLCSAQQSFNHRIDSRRIASHTRGNSGAVIAPFSALYIFYPLPHLPPPPHIIPSGHLLHASSSHYPPFLSTTIFLTSPPLLFQLPCSAFYFCFGSINVLPTYLPSTPMGDTRASDRGATYRLFPFSTDSYNFAISLIYARCCAKPSPTDFPLLAHPALSEFTLCARTSSPHLSMELSVFSYH